MIRFLLLATLFGFTNVNALWSNITHQNYDSAEEHIDGVYAKLGLTENTSKISEAIKELVGLLFNAHSLTEYQEDFDKTIVQAFDDVDLTTGYGFRESNGDDRDEETLEKIVALASFVGCFYDAVYETEASEFDTEREFHIANYSSMPLEEKEHAVALVQIMTASANREFRTSNAELSKDIADKDEALLEQYRESIKKGQAMFAERMFSERFRDDLIDIKGSELSVYSLGDEESIGQAKYVDFKDEPTGGRIIYFRYLGNIDKINTEKILGVHLSSDHKQELGGLADKAANLVYLSLRGVSDEKITNNLDKFKNIKSLTLDYIKSTAIKPVIKPLERIKKLPDNIGSLENLTKLYVNTAFKDYVAEEGKYFDVSNASGLSNLETLIISNSTVYKLPASIGNLKKLNNLKVNSAQLSSLPSELGSLTKLVNLELDKNSLENLNVDFSKLGRLTTIKLIRNNLIELPDSIGELENLWELNLQGNGTLKNIPDSIKGLKRLYYLILKESKGLTLPDSIGELSNLYKIDLSSSKSIKIPDSIKQLQSLRVLDTSHSSDLTYPNGLERAIKKD